MTTKRRVEKNYQAMSKWSQEIDEITTNFTQTFSELSTEQLNWKPEANSWSIAQNIEHLIVINSTYFPVMEDVKEGNYEPPFVAKLGFIVSLFGWMLLQAVQPNRKWKSKTMPMWEPEKGSVSPGILARFEDHQEKLKRYIEDTKDRAEEGAVISSPANKNLVIKLKKAFEIIVTHEKRHFEQAKEVLHFMQSHSK